MFISIRKIHFFYRYVHKWSQVKRVTVAPPLKLDFYLTPHVFWRYHICLDVYVLPLKYEKLWKDKNLKLLHYAA